MIDEIASVSLKYLPIKTAIYTEDVHETVVSCTEMIPTLRNQRSSGLCWLYAALSMVEYLYYSKENKFYPDIVFLYKKHIKGCVECFVKDLKDSKGLERIIVLNRGIQDGGSFGMFKHLVEKYGIPITKNERQEWPYNFHNTNTFRSYLTSYILNGGTMKGANSIIERCMGPDHEHIEIFKPNIKKYQLLVHLPDRKKNVWISPSCSNNIKDIGIQDPAYCSSMQTIIEKCINQLEKKLPVWITINIDFSFDFQRGQAGGKQNDVMPIIPINTKKNKLINREIYPMHAVLLIGYKKHKKHKYLWKIFNSWGKRETEHRLKPSMAKQELSWFSVVTHDWFKENVFHACIYDKSLVPKNIKTLDKWDIINNVAT